MAKWLRTRTEEIVGNSNGGITYDANKIYRSNFELADLITKAAYNFSPTKHQVFLPLTPEFPLQSSEPSCLEPPQLADSVRLSDPFVMSANRKSLLCKLGAEHKDLSK